MDPKQLIGAGGVPVIIGLVELVKTLFPTLDARFYPTIAVLFGLVLNEALAYLAKLDYGWAALVGLLAGLAAAKLFEYGKTVSQPQVQWPKPETYDPHRTVG